VAVNAQPVARAHKLRWQVSSRGAGRSVVLQVRRGGHPLKLRVTLEDLPEEQAPVAPVAARPSPPSKPVRSP
jgi:serine protease Do